MGMAEITALISTGRAAFERYMHFHERSLFLILCMISSHNGLRFRDVEICRPRYFSGREPLEHPESLIRSELGASETPKVRQVDFSKLISKPVASEKPMRMILILLLAHKEGLTHMIVSSTNCK